MEAALWGRLATVQYLVKQGVNAREARLPGTWPLMAFTSSNHLCQQEGLLFLV